MIDDMTSCTLETDQSTLNSKSAQGLSKVLNYIVYPLYTQCVKQPIWSLYKIIL